MRFAREMDCETIQVSLASPYPGTELFEYVTANGFLAVDPLLDGTATRSARSLIRA